jgi:murein DD-endopeptidase MepM/ murein hydrolase activator NlpD
VDRTFSLRALRRSLDAATSTLATTDGRWALVSTTITGLVAGSMAWLAASTMPPLHVKTQVASTTFLPYRLFSELTQMGNNLGSTHQTVAPPARLDDALQDQDTEDAGNQGPQTRTLTLDSGDTLVSAIQNTGATKDEANAAVVALSKIYDVRGARAGQTFTLTFDVAPPAPAPAKPAAKPERALVNVNGKPVFVDKSDVDSSDGNTSAAPPLGRLLSVSFSPSVEHDIAVTRQADGSFAGSDTVKQLAEHTHRAGATIDSSLYLAATQAGIPTDVTVEMIKLFSYKVDFQRDLRPGDTFEVYYNYYYTPDGQPAREGNIDYAMMRTGGHQYAVYRYQPDPTQPAEYFDAHGESLKGMLMKTPVDGARITSGFGMRFHPILGYTRMHKGIDFGVPLGTPVMAAGSGTIEEAHWKGGYGNFVLINHGNGYETAYGHLSRYAPGIHPGTRVHQGQIVAFSGSTGESTGPHLHYEIRINKTQVNPLTVKVAKGRILSGHELRNFLVGRLHTDAVMASTPLEAKVADNPTDLRQAKAR